MNRKIMILMAAAALAGCCSSSLETAAAKDAALLQGGWVVRNVDQAPTLFRSLVTVEFSADGSVAGQAGCNAFSGQYRAQNGTLAFSNIAATKKACRADVMMQEKRFLTLLRATRQYRLDESGALHLTTQDGKTIRAEQSR